MSIFMSVGIFQLERAVLYEGNVRYPILQLL